MSCHLAISARTHGQLGGGMALGMMPHTWTIFHPWRVGRLMGSLEPFGLIKCAGVKRITETYTTNVQ